MLAQINRAAVAAVDGRVPRGQAAPTHDFGGRDAVRRVSHRVEGGAAPLGITGREKRTQYK